MRCLLVLILLLLPAFSDPAAAAGEEFSSAPEFLLWPADAQDGKGAPAATVVPSRGDGVTRLTDVTSPSLLLYRAEPTTAPAPAVLVCPGGGYKILAINHEGTQVAEWLNSLGITAVVLKYRVPQNREGAFQDAQRAMGLIRQHAEAWNIDPERVGVLGFSAGAHLAARLCSRPEPRTYHPEDGADRLSARPNFAVLVYPAYLADKQFQLADEVSVTTSTPPTFLVQTQDDRNHVFSSLGYALALQKAQVPVELHLFPKGGHGYGLRDRGDAVAAWPQLCARWLRGILNLP